VVQSDFDKKQVSFSLADQRRIACTLQEKMFSFSCSWELRGDEPSLLMLKGKSSISCTLQMQSAHLNDGYASFF
jgi:hypothetical protein